MRVDATDYVDPDDPQCRTYREIGQAIAVMSSHFDGATWCVHRTESALHDPRVLPHGHPATWRQGVAMVTLQLAQRIGGATTVQHVVVG